MLREVANTVLWHDCLCDTMDRKYEALERKVYDLGSQVSGLRQIVKLYQPPE